MAAILSLPQCANNLSPQGWNIKKHLPQQHITYIQEAMQQKETHYCHLLVEGGSTHSIRRQGNRCC